MKRSSRTGVLVATAALVWGSSLPAHPSGDGQGGSFTAALFDPSSIDPLLSDNVDALQVVRLLFRGLTEVDDEQRVVGAVAKSWDANADATRFTFHLRDDVHFHNGRRVVADDFVFTFNRAAKDGVGGTPIKGWDAVAEGGAETVAGVTAEDESTLVVETDGPYALLPMELSALIFAPVPKEALENEAEAAAFAQRPVGNGPYEMAAPRDDARIVLTRFDRYFGSPGEAQSIEFRLFPFTEREAALEDVRAGRLDISQVPVDAEDSARREFGSRFTSHETAAIFYLAYPLDRPPYDRPGIREALSLAIDREALLRHAGVSGFVPAGGLAHPGLAGGRGDRCPACTYDPGRAQEVFAAAGGAGEGPVRIYTVAGNAVGLRATQFLVDGWKQTLGLDVEVVELGFDEFLAARKRGDVDGIFATSLAAVTPTAYDPLSLVVATDGGWNESGYSNSEVDDLLRRVQTASSTEDQAELLDAVQTIVGRELPVIPVAFHSVAHVWSERVDGLRVDFLSAAYYDEVAVDPG